MVDVRFLWARYRCREKPDIYRCICSLHDIIGFYADIHNIFGTLWAIIYILRTAKEITGTTAGKWFLRKDYIN